MHRLRAYFSLAAAVVASAAIPVAVAVPAGAAATSFLVSSARASAPVGSQGETFFTDNIYVTAGTNIVLSGSSDGRSDFWVDDILQMQVTHQDGSYSTYRADDSNNCTATSVNTTRRVPLGQYLHSGVNRIQLTFHDQCGGNDGNSDIFLTGDNLAVTPGPPVLDAGTFFGINYQNNTSITDCTTGFGTHDATGASWILGAKHCADGSSGNQKDNGKLAKFSPMLFRFYNPVANAKGAPLAEAIACGKHSSTTCVVPEPNSDTGDFFAWRPDEAIASDRVQTAASVTPLPVIRDEPIGDIIPDQTQICHYGAGSAFHGKAESCNTIYSAAEQKKFCKWAGGCQSGVYYGPMAGYGGDSGGPVYMYNSTRTGVFAVGIDISSTDPFYYCPSKGQCTLVSGFIPIDTVLQRLGLTLNQSS